MSMDYLEQELKEMRKYLKGSIVEGMMLAAEIKSKWNPKIEDFIEKSLGILANSRSFRREIDDLISKSKTDLGADFIESVEDAIVEYAETSYDVGLLMHLKADQKAEVSQDVINSLHDVTKSTKKNVGRTVKRWFKTTQGAYFERFIVPKLDNLVSELENLSEDERVITLNKLGRDYKKFAEADGYWDSVSNLDTALATSIGEIDYFQETGVRYYRIVAMFDKATCPVCANISGTEFPVQEAQEYKSDALWATTPEDFKEKHPWPRKVDVVGVGDLSNSGYCLPPYHSNCRCIVEPR